MGNQQLQVAGVLVIIISLISLIKISITPPGFAGNNELSSPGKGYIYILLSLELLLLGVSLIFISSALFLDDMGGIMTALYILTIGAAESAIGLSLITAVLTNPFPPKGGE